MKKSVYLLSAALAVGSIALAGGQDPASTARDQSQSQSHSQNEPAAKNQAASQDEAQPRQSDLDRQLEKVRAQVAAGLLPASKLAELQKAVDDAADDAILQKTLYGDVKLEDLNDAQAAAMVAAAARRVSRTRAEVEHDEDLIANGVAAADLAAPAEAELARRKTALDQAKERAELLSEISAVVHADVEATPVATATPSGPKAKKEYVDGSHGLLTSADIKELTLAFEKKFDKPLPVSARGETALHRSLGLDHTGRIDVAVMPDSAEGVWLRRYLETKDIAYYAFRVAIAGKATGAHIHIGPGSTRLIPTD